MNKLVFFTRLPIVSLVLIVFVITIQGCSNRANNSGSPFGPNQGFNNVNQFPPNNQHGQFPNNQNNFPIQNNNDFYNCHVGNGQYQIGNRCVTAFNLMDACAKANGTMVRPNLCKVSMQTQRTDSFTINFTFFGLNQFQFPMINPFAGQNFNMNDNASTSSVIVDFKMTPRRMDAGTRFRLGSQFSVDLLINGTVADTYRQTFDTMNNPNDIVTPVLPSRGADSIDYYSSSSNIIAGGCVQYPSDVVISSGGGCFPQPTTPTVESKNTNERWVPFYGKLRANATDSAILALQIQSNRSFTMSAQVTMARCTDGFQSQVCPEEIPRAIPVL